MTNDGYRETSIIKLGGSLIVPSEGSRPATFANSNCSFASKSQTTNGDFSSLWGVDW